MGRRRRARAPARRRAALRQSDPGADGRSVGDEVSHYAFLADNPEFADVRELVASEAVAFFEANLR